ncbi:MAG: hypothetical protein H7A36_04390 [Chlamydiales bacterium]|nr:hypothetical protein [Chlamydiales bacterium]
MLRLSSILKLTLISYVCAQPLYAGGLFEREGENFLPFCGITSKTKPTRSFEEGISASQLEDLRFTMTSLAYQSFSEVLSNRIQLQDAMARVNEVHPLHFTTAVFIDAELTRCIHLIREKQWLWRHFHTRIKRTFAEEAECDNLRPEYVQKFTDELKLDCDEFLSYVVDQDWDALIARLLKKFPLEVQK